VLLQWSEVTIEVIELDQEDAMFWELLVVFVDVANQLQSYGRFAGPFWAENDGGCRLLGVADDFAPGRVKSAGHTELAENGVRLGIFVRERVTS